MIGLGVFAKPPRPGLVKTRLIPDIGAGNAARIYRYCLEHALEHSRRCGLHYRVYLSEASEHELFGGETCAIQCGGDLGTRMIHAMGDLLQTYTSGAIIIGTDCLDLQSNHLQSAARALASHEIVIQPALDGGYALIGCKRAEPALFSGVEWSTEHALEQTLANAKKLNYRVSLLETVRDIDTLHDLEQYPELRALIKPA